MTYNYCINNKTLLKVKRYHFDTFLASNRNVVFLVAIYLTANYQDFLNIIDKSRIFFI